MTISRWTSTTYGQEVANFNPRELDNYFTKKFSRPPCPENRYFLIFKRAKTVREKNLVHFVRNPLFSFFPHVLFFYLQIGWKCNTPTNVKTGQFKQHEPAGPCWESTWICTLFLNQSSNVYTFKVLMYRFVPFYRLQLLFFLFVEVLLKQSLTPLKLWCIDLFLFIGLSFYFFLFYSWKCYRTK